MESVRGASRINFRVIQNFTKKKSIAITCVKTKGFYCRLLWSKLHRNEDIMALTLQDKLSEQRITFKNLLSFFLSSLLHGIIKVSIKSFTRSAFVQYKHHTLPAHLEDVNLLFK